MSGCVIVRWVIVRVGNCPYPLKVRQNVCPKCVQAEIELKKQVTLMSWNIYIMLTVCNELRVLT